MEGWIFFLWRGAPGGPLKNFEFFRGYIFWGALKPPQKWKIPEKNYWTLFITLKGILFRGGMIIFSRNRFLRDFLVRAIDSWPLFGLNADFFAMSLDCDGGTNILRIYPWIVCSSTRDHTGQVTPSQGYSSVLCPWLVRLSPRMENILQRQVSVLCNILHRKYRSDSWKRKILKFSPETNFPL